MGVGEEVKVRNQMRLKEGDPFVSFASCVASERLSLGCSLLQRAETMGEYGLHRRRLSRASSERSNPSLVPRRKHGAGNRKVSQKRLRARKIQSQHGIEGSGHEEPGNSATNIYFLQSLNVP